MLGVRAISCICITRFAERKGAVVIICGLKDENNEVSVLLSGNKRTCRHIFACGMSHFYLWESSRNYRPGLHEAWLALLNRP